MEEQPQSAKRKRRPSVRLGEIGYSGPYDASSMWTEVPRQRKKPQPGVKPPRIRPLEHLAAETAVIEEEWGVIEPIQPEQHQQQQQNDDDDSGAPVIKEQQQQQQQIKRRKPRTTTKQHQQVQQQQPEVAPPSPEDDDDDEEKDYEEEAPLEEAPSSSDSEEDLPASDDSEQANPNSHEMQGAIEDGPNRRSRAQPRVSNKSSIRDREHEIELATIKDPVPSLALVPNGTPNSSSQREMLSAGVSGWLQDLGLGKYSELFELNEVDTEVLPLLTFDDLREMGVEAVGARRKMFHGIQELGQLRGI